MPERRSTRYLRYIVELAVVFLGVWLGLLAEDYRQTRQEREAERVSLGRLIADLDSDALDMAGNLERTTASHAAARWVLDRSDARGVDSDSLAEHLSTIHFISLLTPNTSEYSALKSTGRINLIRNQELRQGLTQLYEGYPYINALHDRDADRLDAAMAEIAPHVRMQVMHGRVFPTVRVVGDPDVILSDAAFLREVSAMVGYRSLLERQYLSLIEHVASLQAQARVELGPVE